MSGYTAEQLGQGVALEQIRGHLAASLADVERGDIESARLHAAHPLVENVSLLDAPLKAKDASLTRNTGKVLNDYLKSFDGASSRQANVNVAQVNTVLDQAGRTLLPASISGDVRFQSNVIAALLDLVADEYGEGLSGDTVKLEMEYQDAYGFFQRARLLWQGIGESVKAKAPESFSSIEGAFNRMSLAFVSVDAPARAVPMEQVESGARDIRRGLVEATGFVEPGPAGSGRSAADQLRTIGKQVDAALNAIDRGDVQAARDAYEGFDQGWDRIEDGIRARSREIYRKIESAMGDVTLSLMKPETIDRARATTALKQLDDTIRSSLPGLE